jgi:Raf kinase inhibitor-like YbhB/YbcL family protein
MKISSPAFENNDMIPSEYTCHGSDTSPPLIISGVPKEAKSLATIMDDPDAPMGIFTHWVVWNIPPTKNAVHKRREDIVSSRKDKFWRQVLWRTMSTEWYT